MSLALTLFIISLPQMLKYGRFSITSEHQGGSYCIPSDGIFYKELNQKLIEINFL